MARGAILPETMVSDAGKPPPANRGGRAYGSGIMQPNADVNDVRYLYLMKDCGGRNGVALPRAVPSNELPGGATESHPNLATHSHQVAWLFAELLPHSVR